MKQKDFIIKIEKMHNQTEFMKRIYKLSVWLIKRYNIPCEDVDFYYGYLKNQKENNLITIRLTFKYEEKN